MWISKKTYKILEAKLKICEDSIGKQNELAEHWKKLYNDLYRKSVQKQPVEITNSFEQYCRGCKECDPTMQVSEWYAGDKYETKVNVLCKNTELCKRLNERMENTD